MRVTVTLAFARAGHAGGTVAGRDHLDGAALLGQAADVVGDEAARGVAGEARIRAGQDADDHRLSSTAGSSAGASAPPRAQRRARRGERTSETGS